MRVIHLNACDMSGGAAIAAARLHRAMLTEGVDSRLWVYEKLSSDKSVESVYPKRLRRYGTGRGYIVNKVLNLFYDQAQAYRSLNVLPSGIHIKINRSNADVVNLHWINGEMISILEIAKITKPIVWTLHDMWPFLGTKHYTDNGIDDYTDALLTKSWLDIDALLYRHKRRYWQNIAVNFVSPSKWLASELENSHLFRGSQVDVIPNTIDFDEYKYVDKQSAKAALGISLNKLVIMFAAVSALDDRRKGFDHLLQSLKTLLFMGVAAKHLLLLVVGGEQTATLAELDLETLCAGRVADQNQMNKYYGAADVFVLPSRLDNFPNTMVEAMASGTACVGYTVGGIPDLIEHKINGYLAQAGDTSDFAAGIKWVLSGSQEQRIQLSNNARRIVGEYCNPREVILSYCRVYRDALAKSERKQIDE